MPTGSARPGSSSSGEYRGITRGMRNVGSRDGAILLAVGADALLFGEQRKMCRKGDVGENETEPIGWKRLGRTVWSIKIRALNIYERRAYLLVTHWTELSVINIHFPDELNGQSFLAVPCWFAIRACLTQSC